MPSPTYLDFDGLNTYDGLIKAEISGKIDIGGRAGKIPYGNVDAASTATAFTATVDGLTELTDGTTVMLHNGVVTSASGFTVNVNGLGAKKVYNNMTNATQDTTIFNVAYTMLFVYSTALDSGNGGWWCYRGYDANTTYTPMKLGFGHGHCTTAAATAAKAVAVSGYVLNTGGIVSVLFDHDVQAGATLNVTSKGAKAIYYKGAAIAGGIIKAGDTATFVYSGQYHLLSVDRWGSDIDAMAAGLDGKQDALVSGTNIKTVNGNSLLGSGDLAVGGSVSMTEEEVDAAVEAAWPAPTGYAITPNEVYVEMGHLLAIGLSDSVEQGEFVATAGEGETVYVMGVGHWEPVVTTDSTGTSVSWSFYSSSQNTKLYTFTMPAEAVTVAMTYND